MRPNALAAQLPPEPFQWKHANAVRVGLCVAGNVAPEKTLFRAVRLLRLARLTRVIKYEQNHCEYNRNRLSHPPACSVSFGASLCDPRCELLALGVF